MNAPRACPPPSSAPRRCRLLGRLPRCSALLVLILLHAGVCLAGAVSADPQRGLAVEDVTPWSTAESVYLPLCLRITNRGAACEVRIEAGLIAEEQTLLSRRTVHCPAGEMRIYLPLLRAGLDAGRVEVRFRVDGEAAPRLTLPGPPAYTLRKSFAVLVAGEGAAELATELAQERNRLPGSGFEISALAPDALPPLWQCYAGLRGAVILHADAARSLPEPQRRALVTWVRYGGGLLWLHGAQPRMGAVDLNLPLRRQHAFSWSMESPAAPALYRCVTGAVLLSATDALPDLNPSLLRRAAAQQAVLAEGLFPPRLLAADYRHDGALYRDLHRVPALGYSLFSVALAVLIGPVNLLLLRRWRRQSLFYLTAPLLAVGGMGLIGGYSVLSEGLGVRGNEHGLLLHEVETGSGAVYQDRGLYAGLAAPPLALSEFAVALPLRRGEMTRLAMTWGPSLRLEEGWLPTRTPCGLRTLTPVRVRAGVSVREDAEGLLRLRNDLPATLTRAVCRRFSSRGRQLEYYQAERVPPGEEVPLRRLNVSGHGIPPAALPEQAAPFLPLQQLPWSLWAETSALPYLEEGGLEVEWLSRRCLYVAVEGGGIEPDD